MKLFCAPRDLITTSSQDIKIPVVLYSRTDTSNTVSIGATLLERLIRKKFVPAHRAWDLLSIALSVIAADTSVSRRESPDGWTRQLEIQVAVNDPVFWSSQKDLLENQLQFLTTDLWSFEFVDGGILPKPPRWGGNKPDQDSVCLLSGGMDSLVGAIDLSKSGMNPYLVSQVSKGDTQKQRYFAKKIDGGLNRVELNHSVKCPWPNERSQRARSIIFLAYGVLMATTLKQYHNGNPVTLYVCENGFISINPALTTARLGSLSTRTTHPVFIYQFQELLNAAGLKVKIENPYQFMTKGEMLIECADQAFLNTHAANTTSCGRYGHFSYRHCGRCVPCLIRRASFHTWGVVDATGYVYDDLSKDNSEHARFDDVRSAAAAVAEVKNIGFDRWFRPRLNAVSLGDTSPYKEVVRRGLHELGVFLESAGGEVIDFHCHLDLFPEPSKIADRCEKEGIYVLSVTTTPKAWHGTRKLERSRIRTALGLHPQLAHERRSELGLFDELLYESRYVGEIGLDGTPPFRAHWQDQIAVFDHILKSCAEAGGRVLSVHSRRSATAVIDYLESVPGAGIPILHWFTGTPRELSRAANFGCWFSVGPAMLSSEKGRKLAAKMPRDRVLTESDGPFAQVARQTAMPWDVALAEKVLAQIWGLDRKETATRLSNNLKHLVSLV